jgi:hypothetical protein
MVSEPCFSMRRVDDGRALSHLVEFVKDGDGVWRVSFF